MALIDASRNHFFELAKERWQAQGFDADITDILEGYRAETNKKIKKDSMPSDFYKLLEIMTISRSRKHITSYYGDKGVVSSWRKTSQIHIIVILIQRRNFYISERPMSFLKP